MPKSHFVGITVGVDTAKIVRPEHMIRRGLAYRPAQLVLELLVDHVRHAVVFRKRLGRRQLHDQVELRLRVVLFGTKAELQRDPYESRRARLP